MLAVRALTRLLVYSSCHRSGCLVRARHMMGVGCGGPPSHLPSHLEKNERLSVYHRSLDDGWMEDVFAPSYNNIYILLTAVRSITSLSLFYWSTPTVFLPSPLPIRDSPTAGHRRAAVGYQAGTKHELYVRDDRKGVTRLYSCRVSCNVDHSKLNDNMMCGIPNLHAVLRIILLLYYVSQQ